MKTKGLPHVSMWAALYFYIADPLLEFRLQRQQLRLEIV